MEEYFIEEIKSLSSDEKDIIRNLTTQLDTSFQQLSDEDFSFMLQSSSNHLYVARLKSSRKIVGMVTLIVYRIPYKMKAWIEDIVVDESQRGNGVGRRLLDHAIDEARRFHVKSLNLTSNPTRESANKLYVSIGFEKRDTNVYRMTLTEE